MTSERRILIVSSAPFLPAGSGVRTRLLGVIDGLEALGYEITFLYVVLFRFQLDRVALGPMRQRLRDRLVVLDPWDSWGLPGRCLSWLWTHLLARPARQPLTLLRSWMARFSRAREHNRLDDWYPSDLDRLIRSLGNRWKAIWVVQVFLSRALEAFKGDGLRLLDTIDLFTERHQLLRQHGLSYSWFSLTESEELRGLRRADRVLAIAEPDRQWLASRVGRPLYLLEPLLAPCPLPAPTSPPTLLLLGSDNPHNRRGLQWFLKEVWPSLHRSMPEVRLWLAGPLSVSGPSGPAITCHGLVDQVQPLYACAWICLNPVLEGSGVAIKSLEALAFGRPLLATSAGARGMEEWSECGLCLAEPGEWLERLSELLRDARLRQRLMAAAANLGPRLLARAHRQLEAVLHG